MNNELVFDVPQNAIHPSFPEVIPKKLVGMRQIFRNQLPEILFITSYPPRECGIATYSQDLLKALKNQYRNSFSLKVCALEAGTNDYTYPKEVKYQLNTQDLSQYPEMAHLINVDMRIELVLIQHEFGFFQGKAEGAFLQFLSWMTKPVVIVFHTVLPNPDAALKEKVQKIAAACASIVVMTQNSAQVLIDDYGVLPQNIEVIPHGTHLVPHLDKTTLKEKYGLSNRKVLSTFGLLNSGKGIETTLIALPAIIALNPEVLFLIIGKTHPGVIKSEGEKYRMMLLQKVQELKLQQHVIFINSYLPLQDLLEYLQLTDVYLFTSQDPNQAVSGTFSYAMSCGCPIISTPIPHAREVLREDSGIIVDFQHVAQLANGVNRILGDESLSAAFRSNTLQRIVPSAWENSAIAHALLLQKVAGSRIGLDIFSQEPSSIRHKAEKIALQNRLPEVNLEHVKKMTTDFGMIQFAKINQPDIDSGYTLDDNARALIAMCMHYESSGDINDLEYLRIYLDFIQFCQQPAGDFLNYVDKAYLFTAQNSATNLADSNGRAIWALGYLISRRALLPTALVTMAQGILHRALLQVEGMHSTRAMAFVIKGLYYANLEKKSLHYVQLIKTLANRLVQMYRHESEQHWQWYEGYLTYANSILPEALLCAWLETGAEVYKETAEASFNFLLSRTFDKTRIKVISNQSWLHKGQESAVYGEQPIDVAYTIFTLSKFYDVFEDENHLHKMETAFNWFLGNNHLHQIIYNPCTGGCYDGLEEKQVNLNQGAESTLSYLMARLTMEKYLKTQAK
ncbi:glycosyltransferase [Haliscomenobacter hydrossis]|uniref:Glycosyl transferase group 1 n=1 Tax=Haliscomenobacter hydrossis (strain ATCC 27775 / DSM 1100 / LMG 10767 / O) TaxID=760192 RepID=F4KVT0_HALH1|nr:glycosyltransferase [Haliscomenobacter hydrossis]AEE53505.1 glycosyl transferase group 1 [Haliscomenobacter hydrossis DSM 1100]